MVSEVVKRNFVLLLMAIVSVLKSFGYVDRGCAFYIEGTDPESKKYSFVINKPKDFDASMYQFMVWKVLKSKGYELVSQSCADIIIQLNFINREKDAEGHENVFAGEITTDIRGQQVKTPIYENRSTGHYLDKYVTLDIKALPIGSNENSIPLWKMAMDWSEHASKEDFIYGIDFIWLKEGYHYINFRIDTKDGKPYITKLRDGKEKATKEQTQKFTERVQYIKSRIDADVYNKELNR